MDNQHPPFVSDILSQAEALHEALDKYDPSILHHQVKALQDQDYDRIILTGMGASFYALYPTWLYLTQKGIPAVWVDTAELVHYAHQLLTPRSLVWAVSQSGGSGEIKSLIEHIKDHPVGSLLAFTNDTDNPLKEAASADRQFAMMPIYARSEATVSTRTYLNTLAFTQLSARVFAGQDLSSDYRALWDTAEAIATYLSKWQEHQKTIGEQLGNPEKLVLVGRGNSLATVDCGATGLAEAAKMHGVGMASGEFRHGPLDICAPDLSVLVYAGPPQTMELNFNLAQDIIRYHGKAYWLGPQQPEIPSLPMPQVELIGLPLVEILPLQLLSLHVSQQKGIEPGKFRYIGKVTAIE